MDLLGAPRSPADVYDGAELSHLVLYAEGWINQTHIKEAPNFGKTIQTMKRWRFIPKGNPLSAPRFYAHELEPLK